MFNRMVFTLALLALACLCRPAAAETVALRGYGKVTADLSPNRAVFTCESAQKADVLLGKLLADLFWDAGAAHLQHTVAVKGAAFTVHSWAPYGALLAARAGRQVVLLGGAEEAAVARSAALEPLLFGRDVACAPAQPYPVYLDAFDLRAYKFYTHAMSSVSKLGLDTHWPFLEQLGLSAMSFQQLLFHRMSPAPGVIETTATDYEMKEAERHGGLVMAGISGGGEFPLWVYNKYPEVMAQPTPTTLFGSWGGAGAAGAHYESWGIPEATLAATGLTFLRQSMQRYLSSPALGGWLLYSGAPGMEMAMHSRSGMYWDYSPVAEGEFRKWLREVRGYTLADMGRRWYGDSGHFTSWDQITVPDLNDFYGGTCVGGVRLADNWQFQPAAPEATVPPPAGDPRWLPYALPPSQQGDFLPWGPSFYRTTFNGDRWQQPGQSLYLACVANNYAREGISLWLNGKLLGQFKPTDNTIGGVQVEITGLVTPGANQLVFKVPSTSPHNEGRIVGPVYLCPVQPKFYPYLGPQLNARYADLRLFQGYGVYRIHLPVAEMARAVDPDRPFVFSPGSGADTADAAEQLAVRFGGSLQNTGREAYTFPYWTGYGYVGGFYGTSEPSATTTGPNLDRLLGMISFDGDSNHILFWDIENYINYEKETGWFTKHARQIQLFGKALRDNPRLVLYRSSRNALLGSTTFSRYDIGNSDMQAAHYDNVYANDSDVLSGRIDKFPVLFDTGDDFLEPDMLAALTRYVTNGGTFVASPATGRHTLEEVNSYPLGPLVGCTLANPQKRGTLRFGTNLPVLNAYAGQSFAADGIALTPVPGPHAIVPLATWEDGTLAIGVRQVGQGRVIVLGSGFWRAEGLRNDFYDKFFGDLGIGRTATADSPTVWTHKFVTKNGLQDWIIAFNITNAPQTVGLAYQVAGQPAVVWNMTTRQAVDFTYTPEGWVRLAPVSLDPQSLAIFGSPRGSLLGGLPVWWGEKTKYWKRCDATAPAVPAAPAEVIALDQWRFTPDPDAKISATEAWKTAGFADGAWQSVPSGIWDLIFTDPARRHYHGLALYRRSFTLPAAWSGHRVTLNLECFNTPIVYDAGEFYLNGKLVTTYAARGWAQFYNYDVTALLRPGTNVLAVKVTGGAQFSGIAAPIWLAPEKLLSPVIDLAGPWAAVKQDYRTQETVTLPGTVTARYLVRTVALPADWAQKTVYLHVETGRQWLGSVVVNGHPLNLNAALHPYPLRAEINLTPFLKPGQDNRLELWPYQTIPGKGNPNDLEEEKVDILALRLGCL